MSDFLERLAMRAIGSETSLVPRLASLFEPLPRAPGMSLPDDGTTSPRHREAVPPATASSTVAPMRFQHVPVMAPPDAWRVTPVAPDPVAARTPAPVAPSTPRDVAQPALIAATPAVSPVVERSVASPMSARPTEAFATQPVRPRRTPVAADQTETTMPPHASSGALLTAFAPVFSAPHTADTPTRSSPADVMRALAAQPGTGDVVSEPVIHVSIGRLEVRAAPAPATPPRHRDGPPPSSLDHYLRQRGGKAAP